MKVRSTRGNCFEDSDRLLAPPHSRKIRSNPAVSTSSEVMNVLVRLMEKLKEQLGASSQSIHKLLQLQLPALSATSIAPEDQESQISVVGG